MTKGLTPQERYYNQSDDERKNAEYIATRQGGLSTLPKVEWHEDQEWCYDHAIPFHQVIKHAWPQRDDHRILQIPRIHPPISLQDMFVGTEAIDLTPRHVRYSQVVREEWYENVRIPTRVEYNSERNVLAIWYRQEIHLFTIWIGDDGDDVPDAQ